MTSHRKRILPLIAIAALAAGAIGAAGAAVASDDYGERGHMERSERGEMSHGRHYADRDRDREHMEYRGRVAPMGANALSIDAFIGKLKEQGYSDVTGIEHKDGGVVEVRAKDKTGALVELSVDGKTGAVLRSKSE